MEQYLMTQSLISAWSYTFDCYEGNEEAAMSDFLRVLKRERSEPTEAMQNGLAFERECYMQAAGARRPPHPKWEDGIQKVAGIIQGGQFQVRVQEEVQLNGVSFLIYGILDVLKAGTIYDLKFSNKDFGQVELAGKYLESVQHPLYLRMVPEALEFRYLVSDGSNLYIECYQKDEVRPAEEIIAQFISSIRDMGLFPVYQEKWLARD